MPPRIAEGRGKGVRRPDSLGPSYEAWWSRINVNGLGVWGKLSTDCCRFPFPCFLGMAAQEGGDDEMSQVPGLPFGPRRVFFTQVWHDGEGVRPALYRGAMPTQALWDDVALDVRRVGASQVGRHLGPNGLVLPDLPD